MKIFGWFSRLFPLEQEYSLFSEAVRPMEKLVDLAIAIDEVSLLAPRLFGPPNVGMARRGIEQLRRFDQPDTVISASAFSSITALDEILVKASEGYYFTPLCHQQNRLFGVDRDYDARESFGWITRQIFGSAQSPEFIQKLAEENCFLLSHIIKCTRCARPEGGFEFKLNKSAPSLV